LQSFVTNVGVRQDLSDEKILSHCNRIRRIPTLNRKTEMETLLPYLKTSFSSREFERYYFWVSHTILGGPPKKSKDQNLQNEEEKLTALGNPVSGVIPLFQRGRT